MRWLYTLFALFSTNRACCGFRGATDWCQVALLIALIALKKFCTNVFLFRIRIIIFVESYKI